MTVKEAIANKKVISKQGLTGRLTPYITIGENHALTRFFEFNEGLNITIVEPPKNYKGCGRCVKFLVENSPIEYYEFWSEFKMNIIDPKPPTKSKTPKTKTPKVWTEKQKDRLGDKGYYAEYYDIPNDTPDNYSFFNSCLSLSNLIIIPTTSLFKRSKVIEN
jgi:hypothetical protein